MEFLTLDRLPVDPTEALSALRRYARQFRREGWVERLRGHALLRLGDLGAALDSFRDAVAKEGNNNDNLLALAHCHLEQAELQIAKEYADQALEKARRQPVCLLSQAVILWKMGQCAEALADLAQAQRMERNITRVRDLQYEHFWGPGAVAALGAMLAQRDSAAAELRSGRGQG